MAPKSMEDYFYGTVSRGYGAGDKFISYLDVSHLDVSNSTDFSDCFKRFGGSSKAEIWGLDTWDVGHGINFSRMFAEAFPHNKTVNLDLSTWTFCQDRKIRMSSMFRRFAGWAEEVNLNLSGWNVEKVTDFYETFKYFACRAEKVNISGVDEWTVSREEYILFSYMFESFAPESNCQLDLSKWSKDGALAGKNYYFTFDTFFKVKEPIWAERDGR